MLIVQGQLKIFFQLSLPQFVHQVLCTELTELSLEEVYVVVVFVQHLHQHQHQQELLRQQLHQHVQDIT